MPEHGEKRQLRKKWTGGNRSCSAFAQVAVLCPVASPVNTAQMWWLNTVSAGLAGCGVTLWACVLWMCVQEVKPCKQKGSVCAECPPATLSISQVNTHIETRRGPFVPVTLFLVTFYVQAGLRTNINQNPKIIFILFTINSQGKNNYYVTLIANNSANVLCISVIFHTLIETTIMWELYAHKL